MTKDNWFTRLPWVHMYLMRVRDPIIADRSLDLMAAAFWGFLSAWGVSSAAVGLPTIGGSLGESYQILWGAGIGALCTIAFSAAISTFFNTSNITTRIRRKKIEMLFGSVAGGFISVYPMILLVMVIAGDSTRFAAFWASCVYLVIPTWRIRHLYHRIAKLRQIARDETHPLRIVQDGREEFSDDS